MTHRNPHPLVAVDAAGLEAEAWRWVREPALREAIAVGGGPDAELSSVAAVAAAAAWVADGWDFRRGAERRESRAPVFPGVLIDALLRAGDATGLVRTAPPVLTSYDVTVVLGGAAAGNRLRVAHAAALRLAGIDLGRVVGLTANRPLGGHELKCEPAASADGNEAQHLQRTMREELGGEPGRDPFELVIAPPRPSGRRPDTALAVAHLRTRLTPQQRRSVLFVTSAIYAPYQFFVAAKVLLQTGTHRVETVGTTTTTADPAVVAPRLAQELNATLQAIARLVSSGPAVPVV